MFDNVFLPLLKGETIILSTHQIHFLDRCDYVIALDAGRIEAFGEPEKLNHILEHIVEEEREIQKEEESEKEPEEEEQEEKEKKAALKE